MTRITKYKSKPRRNSFSAGLNNLEDDFPLADVQVLADDSRLRITPLHHIVDDEDAIDRLLVNSGFDIDTRKDQADEKSKVFTVVDNIGEADESDTFNKFDPRDDDEFFAQEPAIADAHEYRHRTERNPDLVDEMTGKHQDLPDQDTDINLDTLQGKTMPSPDFQDNHTIPNYRVVRPETQADESEAKSNFKMTEVIDEPEPVEITIQEFVTQEETLQPIAQQVDVEPITEIMSGQHLSDHQVFAQDSGMTKPNPFKTELESYKKRLYRYKNKAKKATFISYAALGLAIVSLMSTIAMSMMLIDLKAEVSKLSALLEVVKDDVESLTQKDG